MLQCLVVLMWDWPSDIRHCIFKIDKHERILTLCGVENTLIAVVCNHYAWIATWQLACSLQHQTVPMAANTCRSLRHVGIEAAEGSSNKDLGIQLSRPR